MSWQSVSVTQGPILHVLKLQVRPGDLFPKIEFGAVPGYLYSGKIPHDVPVRYLAPRKHAEIPTADIAARDGVRHLFIFDVRPPTIRLAHEAAWGTASFQAHLNAQQLQRSHWAQPGHSLGIGLFRDEQGQIPYAFLDRAPWRYIFRTFWHNQLPGTERPNVPLGTMSCRGTAHVRWAAAMAASLAQLRQELRARSPPAPPTTHPAAAAAAQLTLTLVQNGGGGGYAPGKGGPKGGWWPDRPKSANPKGRAPQQRGAGGLRRQRGGGARQLHQHTSSNATHSLARQLWEGNIDVKADVGALETQVTGPQLLSQVQVVGAKLQQGALHLFASARLGVVAAPAQMGGRGNGPVELGCLQADQPADMLPPTAGCFNPPGPEAHALAFVPRAMIQQAEEGQRPVSLQVRSWAAGMLRMAIAGALRQDAGGVLPPLAPATGPLQAGTIPAVGRMQQAQQLTAAALQRAHAAVEHAFGSAGSSGDVTRRLASSSLCDKQGLLAEWGLLELPAEAWAAVCDVTLPVWHTHTEMNWVWLGTLPGQLLPSSRRKTRCLWNGSLRAFRARTVDFFRRWNIAAKGLWGGAAVTCEMRDAKRFMGDWGSDDNHAVFRDVVFGPNLAGNSPESIRQFDQLAAGVISVTVTAEAGAADDEMWTDGAWPCGRPPGVYAASWLDATVQMQALWGNPAELDTLQMAGTLWLQRHQACVRRDAEQVVHEAMRDRSK